VLNIILSFFLTSVGKVMYQSRYLRSQSYLRNTAANRIVMGGYGTVSYPDPCKTIFQRWGTWNIGWMKIRDAWITSSWWHLQIIVPVLTVLWYALSYNVDKNRWVFVIGPCCLISSLGSLGDLCTISSKWAMQTPRFERHYIPIPLLNSLAAWLASLVTVWQLTAVATAVIQQ